MTALEFLSQVRAVYGKESAVISELKSSLVRISCDPTTVNAIEVLVSGVYMRQWERAVLSSRRTYGHGETDHALKELGL